MPTKTRRTPATTAKTITRTAPPAAPATTPTLSHLFLRHCLERYQANIDRLRELIEAHRYEAAYDFFQQDGFTPYEPFWAAFESIPQIAEEEERHVRIRARNTGEETAETEETLRRMRSFRAGQMAVFLSSMTPPDLERLA